MYKDREKIQTVIFAHPEWPTQAFCKMLAMTIFLLRLKLCLSSSVKHILLLHHCITICLTVAPKDPSQTLIVLNTMQTCKKIHRKTLQDMSTLKKKGHITKSHIGAVAAKEGGRNLGSPPPKAVLIALVGFTSHLTISGSEGYKGGL